MLAHADLSLLVTLKRDCLALIEKKDLARFLSTRYQPKMLVTEKKILKRNLRKWKRKQNPDIFLFFILLLCTDKKINKNSSFIRKSRRERLLSQIWLTASSYMTKYLRISSSTRNPSSYMTLQPLPSEFPYIWGKFLFLFYQCEERCHNWSNFFTDYVKPMSTA